MEYTRLDRRHARMHGFILGLGPVLVGNWGGDSAKIFRTEVPKGRLALLFPVQGLARYGTTTLTPGGGMMGCSGADVAMYTPPTFRGILVATCLARWQEFLETCGLEVVLRDGETRPMPAPAIDYQIIESLADAAASAAEASPGDFRLSANRTALEEQLLLTMTRVIGLWRDPFRPAPMSAAARHRAAVRAREYIESNLEQPLKLEAMCRAAYCSARALEYAFRELFGVSPLAYAKCARLSRVRRDLLDAGVPRRSVTETATRWGFWHLGQFSKDYRSLFGELPSATLARARA